MRIFIAQINPTIGDLEGNTKKILICIERAKTHGFDLILFPELALCGYPPEDLLLHSHFIDAVRGQLEKIIPASSNIMVILGMVRRNVSLSGKPLFNTAAIIHDGHLLGFYDKGLLPTYDVFDERRYFEPGKEVSVWELKGKKIAVIICEDIWQHSGQVDLTKYARDPIMELKPLHPDLLLNLSSSPYQFNKPDVRVKVCAKAATTLNCPVILCCQVGGNDDLVFDGYSVFVDALGNLCQLGKGFEEDELLIDLDAPLCNIKFTYDPIRDLYRALVLGVRDYFSKQGFKKACFGLSGGVDSALVACIATEALGKENILAVGLPSRYTAEMSITSAKKLAKNLGIEFILISIEGPFEDYLKLLQPHFQNRPADVTEENLQSRIRGMILMALSNKLGYLVLSTGNKSELGMGFCTLYGDMAGGLAAISDVLKMQIYELCRWINRKKEIIPKEIIDRPPTAELRPGQLDLDTLPPYEIVDAVLKGYVEEFLSPEEIAKKNQIDLTTVIDLIHRIHLAEYKRRQAPPGIRVSRKAFRIGRRYPIVQKWA
ncbi:MAG: NAD+ synthase [Chlamydiae bacterium]|nr:NAD+ synthase [Chlamydiota bacterium]